jgi:putative DNA primase/helicase
MLNGPSYIKERFSSPIPSSPSPVEAIVPSTALLTGTTGTTGTTPILERGNLLSPSGNDTGTDRDNRDSSSPEVAFITFPTISGYKVNEKGVFDDQGTQITYTPCWVLGSCRDGQQDHWGVVVRWFDRDKKQHQAAYPVSRFHEPGGGLPGELADQGLAVVPGQERNLLKYIAKQNPEQRYRSAISTGWQDGSDVFVMPLPDQIIGGPINGEIFQYQPERYMPTTRSMKPVGTLEDWQREVAALCVGNPVLMFWMSAAFAAPLLRLVGRECGGFHLYGTTSRSKTTVQQMAASVWGDGSDPAYGQGHTFVSKWNATKNAMEGMAAAHNDMPLILDEIGEANPKELGQAIYALAGGTGKRRMSSDATLKDVKSWRTILLSTGEISIADMLQQDGGKPVKGGQAVRLLDIPAVHPDTGDGVLMNLHGEKAAALFADRLKRNCGKYYGTAGPAFVRAMLSVGLETVRAKLRTALDGLSSDLTPREASAEVGRAMQRMALVGAAALMAKELGLVPWEKKHIKEAVEEMVARYLSSRGGVGSEMERSVRSVRDFIQANLDSRFSWLNHTDSIVRTHNRAGFRDNENVYFLDAGFKEACGGRDCKEVRRHLKSIGWLSAPEEGRFRTKISVPGEGRVDVYAISLGKVNTCSDGE